MKLLTCVCGLALSVAGATAADFDLGPHGLLTIEIPDDWAVNAHPVPGINGPVIGYTFCIKPLKDAKAKCVLSFLYLTNGAPDRDVIRSDAMRIGEVFVDGAAGRTEALRDFSLQKGFGAYCVFTNATLVGRVGGTADFKVMGIGEVQPADNMSATVSLLANEADGDEFKAMIKMINSLKIKART